MVTQRHANPLMLLQHLNFACISVILEFLVFLSFLTDLLLHTASSCAYACSRAESHVGCRKGSQTSQGHVKTTTNGFIVWTAGTVAHSAMVRSAARRFNSASAISGVPCGSKTAVDERKLPLISSKLET